MIRDNICTETDGDGALHVLGDGPVHDAFGLTYASYLVWPRVLMQQMPLNWQERFVALLDEFWAEWDFAADKEYAVQVRGEDGRFAKDELANYRHPDHATIEALHRNEIAVLPLGDIA